MSVQPMIRIEKLSKTYRAKAGDVTAVQDLNLSVQRGEIFGLLGPNGAGKTTTVRMLCGLIQPSSGDAWVDGVSVAGNSNAVRALMGLVPEDAGDHQNLTLGEELAYHGALFGLERREVQRRSEHLIQRLGLQDRVKHRLKTFSKGMRRKFHLIRALLHEPRVLLLDEPTAGLDPAIVEEVWDLLNELVADRQVTVILCSHHLEEVERLCQRVAILKRRLLVEGPLAELDGRDRRCRIRVEGSAADLAAKLPRIPGVKTIEAADDVLRFELDGVSQEVVPRAVRCVVEHGGAVLEVARDSRDLRSLYRAAVEQETQLPQEVRP